MKTKKTTEQFIEEARKVHGDKYNYSKVEYYGTHTKVCIICPIHGEFWQMPSEHIKGHGCVYCSKNTNRMPKDTFINRAKEIHGNKYDYSKVDYVNSKTKVCIICPIHGEFWQAPIKHLRGQGCPKCKNNGGIRKKFTAKDFIAKAKEVHGDKYDYSKVEYINNHTEVCIICPKHGEFWQKPINHLSSFGCKKCGVENTIKDFENYLDKAKEIHNNKYDYSKYVFKKTTLKSTIICPIHGEFEMSMRNHLNGRGCPKCGNHYVTQDEIIERFIEKHNNVYDYSKFILKKMNTDSTIICPIHGEFKQSPHNHLYSVIGCPQCAKDKNVSEKRLLEFITDKFPELEIIHSYHNYPLLGKLELDIFIPKYNIAIEYQGVQHFKPIDYFGGDEKFKQQIERDERKRQICEKAKIKLLYFSYNNVYDGIINDEKELIIKIKELIC